MATEFCCVFVTAPNMTVARKLATAALNERLAACANLTPKLESHYWWQGRIESSSEVLVLFKTRKDRLGGLEKCVLKNHPYQTPEFIVTRIEAGNENYLAWIQDSVQPAV